MLAATGKLLGLCLLGYAGLCGFLYAAQDSLLYFPTPPAEARGAEALTLDHDGVPLRVWRIGDGRRALLYFGGNAENVAYSVDDLAGLLPNTTVYLHNYRGYGGSGGTPDQQAFFDDAAFLYDYVAARHEVVSVIGRSLGSGVAAWLAANRPVSRLALVTPFDSIANVAQAAYPFAPVSLLLRDKYRSIDRVPHIEAPVLVLAAGRDRIVPSSNTQALVERFPDSQVRVVTLADRDHNDIARSPRYRPALREFLQPARDPGA